MIAPRKKLSGTIASVPIVGLLMLLAINIAIFKDRATDGPNQLALLFASIIAIIIGVFYLHIPYKELEKKIISSITIALPACILLLVIGSLISIWNIAGIVPSMIFYGLKVIHPGVFLPVCALVCGIISVVTGNSWSTIGTIGVALLGIGNAIHIPIEIVAGAIISGAYFGDKISPLSDTTNLAPAVAGVPVFVHLRHMLITTLPAFALTILLFAILGLKYQGAKSNLDDLAPLILELTSSFNISIFNFIPVILVFALIRTGISAIPALTIGSFLGAVWAYFFQHDLLIKISAEQGIYKLMMETACSGFKGSFKDQLLNELLSRGGMASMLNTIWLIICAMIFGGALEACHILETLASCILKKVVTTTHLVSATIFSCILTNMTASDQYLSIVVPGKMFKEAYTKFNLHPKNLSRALEDGGTVTSILVPWNSCGAYNSSILGVATLGYLPFCFFNLLSPILSILSAAFNFSITQLEENLQSKQCLNQPAKPNQFQQAYSYKSFPVYSRKQASGQAQALPSQKQ